MRITFTVNKDVTIDKEFYERVNKGFTCTGETLTETWESEANKPFDSGSCTYVVFKGRFTPYGMCRDLGDHYIIARWSRYDRIDKETFKYTRDVEDE